MSSTHFKADDYGDVLAVVNDLEKLSYTEYGSYQGEYIATLTDGDRLFYYQGSFGSCSGCDWLEAEKDYTNDWELEYKKAVEYCADIKPKYIVPKSKPLEFIEGEYSWEIKVKE